MMRPTRADVWAVPMGLGLAVFLLFGVGMARESLMLVLSALFTVALCITFLGVALIVTNQERGSVAAKVGVVVSLLPGALGCCLYVEDPGVAWYLLESLSHTFLILIGCCLLPWAWISGRCAGIKTVIGFSLIIYGFRAIVDKGAW